MRGLFAQFPAPLIRALCARALSVAGGRLPRMAAVPVITAAQRRSRLGSRHLLAAAHRAAEPVQIAEALLALHATDPATVHLAVAARTRAEATPAASASLNDALYESRTLTRMLCMRRTMFVVPTPLAPVVDAAAARAVAAKERAQHIKHIRAELGHGEEWYASAAQAALDALRERGESTTAELADAVPALRERITMSPGKPYESHQRVSSRLVGVLAAEGRIRRGRPLGGWTSTQYRWYLAEPHPQLPTDEARSELVRHYLAAYGPATADDVKWWTGWTKTGTAKALAGSGAVDVLVEVGPGPPVEGHALAEDAESAGSAESAGRTPENSVSAPWVALLPALDSTPMGWRHRDWYLEPAHADALFDRFGNVGPTVWVDGQVVGGWAQRARDGELVWRLLTDPGTEARTAVEAEAARLAAYLNAAPFTPSFRTPLERELAEG